MAWDGTIDHSDPLGTSILFTPETGAQGQYTADAFTAPRRGVFRFELYGSGGTRGNADGRLGGNVFAAEGGEGGKTVGYLLMEKGDTVSVRAGGTCCAAFIEREGTVLFAAGGGGAGGAVSDNGLNTGWNCLTTKGGTGGGESGADSTVISHNGTSEDDAIGGRGGTQTAGGAAGGNYTTVKGGDGVYGTGGAAAYSSMPGYAALSGRGGDGYYGGGGGNAHTYQSTDNIEGTHGYGGGGGSGHVASELQTITVIGTTYASATEQGGGAAPGENGRIAVTYYGRALLPVFFDGVQLEKLFFNGTDVQSLTYNGTLIYMRAMMRRWKACLKSMGARFACRAGTRGLSPSASRV